MKQKRMMTLLLTLVMAVTVLCPALGGARPLTASASGVDNIVARADYWYHITWTAQRDVKGWRDQSVYIKGQTYHIPYGQPMSVGKYQIGRAHV